VNKNIITIAALILIGTVLKKLLSKKNKIIKGSYQVPINITNRLDALHSFESRKLDGFGGRMSTKINNALRELYSEGINPDIKKIEIKIDPILFKVDWLAEIGESVDVKIIKGGEVIPVNVTNITSTIEDSERVITQISVKYHLSNKRINQLG